MRFIIFKKREIASLIVWSFFSFSFLQFFSIFIYMTKNNLQYFLVVNALYSSLSFLNYFIFKARFGIKLNYARYLVGNIVFGILITAFSYGYYLIVMLASDHYNSGFYIALLISNIVLGSLLFLFTLIKRSEI
jgi:hypothetical protein